MSLATGLPLKGSFLKKPCNLKCSLYYQGSKGVYETDVSHQLDPLNYNLLNKQYPITLSSLTKLPLIVPANCILSKLQVA